MVVFVAVLLVIFGLLGLAHWYLWRRLVRDVSAPGGRWRRVGTVLAVALPVLAVLNFTLGRSDVPFTVQQVLAWPGYMWLALLLYLLLALLVGELVRPLLGRYLARRDARGARDAGAEQEGPGRTAHDGSPAAAAGSDGGGSGLACATAPGRNTAEAGGDRAGGDPAAEAPGRDGNGSLSPDTAGGTDAAPGEGTTDPAAERAVSRRLFVARTVAAGAAVAAVGTVGSGAYGVLNGPTLKRITVPLAKLPRAAHGYRIAVVSDVHLGPVLGRAHTERIVRTVNSAQPDMVAIVGDLVDGTVEDLGPAAEPLRRLRSRDGTFFVTGNHEYFGDAGEWVEHVRELGIEPLENARRELPGFDLAGVNDVRGEESGEGPDYEKALGDRDPARASVLLAHQPVQIHEAVDHGVDLQLSGHSHGGQLWPGPYLAALANPTVAGLERYGDTQLYVTRGAGAWGPPVRVGAESDVTVVQLASKKA